MSVYFVTPKQLLVQKALLVMNRQLRIFLFISLTVLCVAGSSSAAVGASDDARTGSREYQGRIHALRRAPHCAWNLCPEGGLIHFNPSNGSASGLVVVDVKSGQSGNSKRDRKMHAGHPAERTIPGCHVSRQRRCPDLSRRRAVRRFKSTGPFAFTAAIIPLRLSCRCKSAAAPLISKLS